MLRNLARVVIIVACLVGLGRAQDSGNPTSGTAQAAADAAQNTIAPGSSAAANQTGQFVASGSAQQVAQGAADLASNTAVPGGRWLANATGQWVFGRSPESLELLGKTSLTFLDVTPEGLEHFDVIPELSPVFHWTSGAAYVISPFADLAKATVQEDKVGQSNARFELGVGTVAGILSVAQPIGLPVAIGMGSLELGKAGLRAMSSEDTVNNAEHSLWLAPYHAFQGLNDAVKSTAQAITSDVGRDAARAGIEAALGDLALPLPIVDTKDQIQDSMQPVNTGDLQAPAPTHGDLPSDDQAAQLIAQARQQNADLSAEQRQLSDQAASLSDQLDNSQKQVSEIQAEDQKSYEASLQIAEAEWTSDTPVFQPSVEFDPISAFGGLNGFLQTYISRFLQPAGPNFRQGSSSTYDPCAMGPLLGYRAACGSGSAQSKVQGQQRTPTSAAAPTVCGPGYQTNPGALMAAQAPWNPFSNQPPPWRDPKYGPLDSSGRVAWCVPGGK